MSGYFQRRIKIPVAVFILLGTILLVLAAIRIKGFTRDIPAREYPDLKISDRRVDPSQNPYQIVEQWDKNDERNYAFRKAGLMFVDQEPWDWDYIQTVLQTFAEELQQFEQYVAMAGWKAPIKLGPDANFPELETFRKLIMLKRMEARYLSQIGRNELALEKAFLLVIFGNKIISSDGNLLHILVGIAAMNLGYTTLVEIIDHGKLTNADFAKVANELNQIHIDPVNLENAWKYEFWNFAKIVDDLADQKIDTTDFPSRSTFPIPKDFVFKPNRSKQLYAELIREIILGTPMIRNRAPKIAKNRVVRMRADPFELWRSGNSTGIIMAEMAISALDTICDTYAILGAKHDLVRVRIAIARYKLTRGEWPLSLSALVPEFIDEVPVDPMDGHPLRFDSENLRIYSLGADFIDNGGVTKKKKTQLGDIEEVVIEIYRN